MARIVAEHMLTSACALRLVQGDLTLEVVDAIVNAANSSLMHGGGLAAAIVRRGGEEIQRESTEWVHRHGAVSFRRPAITAAGKMPCRYVIHAVGPVWGSGDEDRKLVETITGVMEMAEAQGFNSIAIPAISTGIFRFPRERAAGIIFDTIAGETGRRHYGSLTEIRVTILDGPTLQAFLSEFLKRWPEGGRQQ
ncbi:MAG: macro domain-containing protein [Anaerolineales bacterium]|nr:macro domain-containing protein [Anaerolineales bacterium]